MEPTQLAINNKYISELYQENPTILPEFIPAITYTFQPGGDYVIYLDN